MGELLVNGSWETDNCTAIKAHYAVYSIPKAAALWCGVPEDKVVQIVQEATQLSRTGVGRSIWTHPAIPCLEPRSRAIAEAIETGELPHGREDGSTVPDGDHVAYEHRHFFGRDLRKWMEKAFPNDKPAFLFDDIERSTHTAISADAYRGPKSEQAETTCLNIIGVMLGKSPRGQTHSILASQPSMIGFLLSCHDGK